MSQTFGITGKNKICDCAHNTFKNDLGGIFMSGKKKEELEKENEQNQQIEEMGQITLDANQEQHRVELLTIIGEVEGHE